LKITSSGVQLSIVRNEELARMFDQMASALEFKGENPYRIVAYRKAARALAELPEDVEELWRRGALQAVPGIGQSIAAHIGEYLKTGHMKRYQEAMRGVPEGLLPLLAVPNLGPKTLALAHRQLGVRDLDGLRQALEEGSLERLPGMGRKKVERILQGLRLYEQSLQRTPLGQALPLVERLIAELRQRTGVDQMEPAGSLRRGRETVGDIDILAAGPPEMIQEFIRLRPVREVLAAGDTKASVMVEGDIQVDLRVIPEASYGAALQYFTGSKSHNIKLRTIAKARGLKISEYGVFQGERCLASRREEEVYAVLGLPLIPPELREDRGEIEAAQQGVLPCLVRTEDVQGDLHVHSNWSDGVSTLEEIARKAHRLGYRYVAICDHSQSVRYAGGLSVERLQRRNEEIRRLNERQEVVLLCGTEVDILQDGGLDYPEEVLRELDFVVAAVHSGFRRHVTERIIAAMENPYVDVIAHPSGRLISSREGYEVNLERVLEAAARTGTALEINASPDRLDLDDLNARRAKELGVKLCLGTDAHGVGMMDWMRLGVTVARRAWLEPADLLNCLPPEELLRGRKRRR